MNQYHNDEIDFIELLAFLYRRKFIIFSVTTLIVIGTVIYSLSVDELYESNASVLPISSSASGMSGVASSLLGGFGIGGGSANTDQEKLMVLFESRNLADRVIKVLRNDIMFELYPDSWDKRKKTWINQSENTPDSVKVIGKFKKTISISQDLSNSSLISISCEMKSAQLAKSVIETYFHELRKFLNETDLTIAQRELRYSKEQLLKNKKQLLSEATFISEYYAKKNLDQDRLNGEVDSITKLSKLINYNIPSSVYLDYLANRQNTLKAVNMILEKSYQNAKITAEKERLGFQVIDSPTTPKMRSYPNRTLMVITSFLIGIFLSIITIGLLTVWNQLRNKIYQNNQLEPSHATKN